MSLTYANFCSAADVAAYKRVKAISMRVAHVGRQVAAEMVNGTLAADGSKEFIETSHGKFRLSMGTNADNSTEQAAHERMNAQPVAMGERAELGRFFAMHGLNAARATQQWLFEVRRRLNT